VDIEKDRGTVGEPLLKEKQQILMREGTGKKGEVPTRKAGGPEKEANCHETESNLAD